MSALAPLSGAQQTSTRPPRVDQLLPLHEGPRPRPTSLAHRPLALFDYANCFANRVLKLPQPRPHDFFSLPVALLLVIELHAHLLSRDGIAEGVFEFAVGLRLRFKQ
jgi:hypothetical protein